MTTRLLFNCDGGSCSLSIAEPPITAAGVTHPVDELEGTGVDVFIHCVNRGGDTYAHPTRVGQVYGDEPIDWTGYNLESAIVAGTRRQELNIRALHAAGLDPTRLVADRAHALGMRFWCSLRMNEQHEDDVDRFGTKISRFKKGNRHLLIETDFAPGVAAYTDRFGYSWTWNYAREEVRQRQLAVVRELLAYPVEGIELDFYGGPWFFKQGAEAAGLSAMTDFVRRVRDACDTTGAGVDLAVRVHPTFEENAARGLDVEGWIREGLVGWVTLMQDVQTDPANDLSRVLAAAKGTGVRIAAGFDPRRRKEALSPEGQARLALAYWQQGVNAVYLFNYDCHREAGRTGAYTDAELEALRILGDAESLTKQLGQGETA